MKVHETRSHAHAVGDEEGKMGGTRKQRGEAAKAQEAGEKSKKAKVESSAAGHPEFEEFGKAARKHLSAEDMRRLLEANSQDPSGSEDLVVLRCLDMLYYGPLEKCPVCGGQLDYKGSSYACQGILSEWSKCPYATREQPRKKEPIKVPEGVGHGMLAEWVKKQDPGRYPQRELSDKPFSGMMISLSGFLSRTHQYWREIIERHGGKVSNSVFGVNCLVVSPSERERGSSSKVTEAMERSISVVREGWLTDSIEKQEMQPMQAYELVADLAPEGKGIPWDKQDTSEEALESLTAPLKMFGKRGVYKDSRLQEEGGKILEKDGILYNCAFSDCDQARGANEFCIMQLIVVPENRLHLYYKRGRVGDDPRAKETVEEKPDVESTIKEFAQMFKDLTGNEFEQWEREKKFTKKPMKFYPIDMDDGADVCHGGLALRQLGVASVHSKLDPMVANFMKVLCGQEIYRYAMMEMGVDSPDLPMGMVTDLHLRRAEEMLVDFVGKVKSAASSDPKTDAMWLDFSNKWFTLMHSTRPFKIRDFQELADNVASVLEGVRDINVASHLIGDISGTTIDDPLSECYRKLGCSIAPVEKESDDYKMIVNYLNKTYEPVVLGDVSYGVSVENIFAVEVSAGPSYDDIKKLPNKKLLWCGTRSSNLLRHLHKGFRPSICHLPAPGYMFGRAIICSDAAAEAARYGFTAVDRSEGFLVLAVVSLGEKVIEMTKPAENAKELEEKKVGVKGVGRKKPDEAEHMEWKDGIQVPCGRLVPSGRDDGPLEYNEYAAYDPKQVSIRFLVGVKYEEQNVERG